MSWSETDHVVETDLSASSPVSASPENKKICPGPRRISVERRTFPPQNKKNMSWSETDQCGETDLSASSPVSATP